MSFEWFYFYMNALCYLCVGCDRFVWCWFACRGCRQWHVRLEWWTTVTGSQSWKLDCTRWGKKSRYVFNRKLIDGCVRNADMTPCIDNFHCKCIHQHIQKPCSVGKHSTRFEQIRHPWAGFHGRGLKINVNTSICGPRFKCFAILFLPDTTDVYIVSWVNVVFCFWYFW